MYVHTYGLAGICVLYMYVSMCVCLYVCVYVITIKENVMNLKFNEPKGFVYDNSSVWSKRSFMSAHTSYWSSKRAFSNAVVKAFIEGKKGLKNGSKI